MKTLKKLNLKRTQNVKKIIENSCLIVCIYIVIDMLNIPTLALNKYSVYGIYFIVAFGMFIFLNKGIINVIRINVKNYFDDIIASCYLATFLYLNLSYFVFCSRFKYKMFVVIFLAITIFVVIRLIQLCFALNKNINKENNINVYDIKELYENGISNSNRDIIFLKERDVNYDLLNRSKVINDLYNSIKFCRNETAFVISLTGEWGAGKTTIINIVKEQLCKDEYIIIDGFEPWKYNNEKSIFLAMFDRIMQKIGINFSLMEIKKFIKVCSAILVSNIDTKVNIFNNESETICRIKNVINEYLKVNNKRVLFIIDNIERTDTNNILIILKTIANILNLDRFIYVLSYDEKEMQDIFKNKLQLNYDYIEKIIQLPLRIPKISKEDMEKICKQCMKNLLLNYGIEEKEIEMYMPAINLFIGNIINLRDFKRKVNSIVNCNFYNKSYLNNIDAFLIELIETENLMLYEIIRENYKYFISEEKELIYGFEYQDSKEYNKKITEFFDQTFSIPQNEKLLPILRLLFPNVEKYASLYRNIYGRIEFRQESTTLYMPSKDEDLYKDSVINKRIFNGKFFDLYFTRQTNAFIELDNKINEFINKINSREYKLNEKSECIELQKIVADLLFSYKDEKQKCLLETLQLYIDKITKNKLILLVILIEFQSYIDNRITFMGLSARKRLELICSEIIKSLDNEEINNLKKMIEINYKNMFFIRGILYWLNPEEKYITEVNKELYNELNSSYEKMLENVVNCDINIYEVVNYNRHNLYCLLKNDRYKSQIANINEETVIRFLSDLINESIGNQYGYRLDTETLFEIKSYEELDEILKKVKQQHLNEKEKFIINIYEKSKDKEKGFHENAIYCDKYIKL